MKKVLVITYYWPPSGGGGVQRWLKFVKYLPEFGWEPIVLTPEQQNAPALDESLSKDISRDLKVIRTPIWEPYSLYRKFTGRNKNENLGAAFASGKKSNKFIEYTSNWIRSNFFIPDARKFWIAPSVKFLQNYIKTNKIDIVVTTGPPHSMHLIGLKLKEQTSIKWLADFRDPWTDIDYFNELRLSSWANARHRALERTVLQKADMVICVSKSNSEKLSSKANANIRVITNGYDENDMVDVKSNLDEKFTIAHIGTFMANRNPDVLWEVLSELISEDPVFKQEMVLHLVGNTDAVILDAINSFGLSDHVMMSKSVDHEKAIQLQKNAQVLLITVNKTGDSKGMVTGKIFEYLVSDRPILAIGPEDGDLAAILKDTGAGVISDFTNKIDLKKHIMKYYQMFKKDSLTVSVQNIEKYSRRNLTLQMAEYLNETIK